MQSNEIKFTTTIKAPPEKIMEALMQEEHIQKWWTNEAKVIDGKGVFGFSDHGDTEARFDMERHDNKVVWKCTKSSMAGTNAWEGTTVTFVLTPEANSTRLDFLQSGYRESPCYQVCNDAWGFFVGTSLKQYLETGKGSPVVNSRKIKKR